MQSADSLGEMLLQRAEPVNAERRRLHGGIYILPSLFTIGTLVCGYYAVLVILKASALIAAGGNGWEESSFAFDAASKALGLAILFDGFDGRIARLTNSSSDFGREFDSLADVITFGVAPALLAFGWGIRPIESAIGPIFGTDIRQVGWIVCFGFVICGAARLARFNIQSARLASDKRYFVGLPIPGAAGVIAAVVHCRKYAISGWGYGLVWLVAVGVLGFLMVSRIRYPSFKALDLRRRRPYVTIIVIGVAVYAIWTYSEYALLVLALAYMLSGPSLRIVSRFRPHPPAPEEAHAA